MGKGGLKIKDGWEVKKLEDVCCYEKNKFSGNSLPYVGLENIESNTGQYLGTLFPKEVKSSTFHFNTSHLLYGRLRPYLNKVLLPSFEGHCSTEIFPILTNEKICREFLFYWFVMNSTVTRINATWTGARMPRANMNQVIKFDIPIPPLVEQKQIVALLDQAFKAIDQAQLNIEKNIANAKELFQSKLNAIFSQDGEGWENHSLGDNSLLTILDGDRGKNYPKKSDFLTEGHCIFMNTGNVRPDGFDFTNVMFITEERDNLLRKGKLERDDVVMTTRGTIGNLGWYNAQVPFDHIRINSGMLIFRVNQQKILPEYLFTIFRSEVMTKQIKEKTSGAAQPQLPIKTLVTFKIPVNSDLEKQKEMVKHIGEMEKKQQKLIAVYVTKLANLEELKKSILQKAFNGELT